MNLKDLRKPLPIESIDFRVQSINKGGYATILAYKDARVDINRLDEVCGALGWKREHTRDNKNCVVSIWDSENKHWVSKEDTGTESNTEKEKGQASDSFKRACFNWGIGIELYDYPLIQVKLNANEFKVEQYNGKDVVKATWDLRLKEWKWSSEFENNVLKKLLAIDNNGKQRFLYELGVVAKPEVVTPKKPSLDNSRFEKALEAIGAGNYKKDALKAEYSLTKEQLKKLENV